MTRLATRTDLALGRRATITVAVAGSADEGLLDVADIFAAGDPTSLRGMAEARMRRDGLSL